MRRRTASVSLALALAATLLVALPAAAGEGIPQATTDLIVALEPSAHAGTVDDLVDRAPVVDEQALDDTLNTISVATADVADVTAELAADPRVAYVEPDVQARVVATPRDPFYPQQWGVPLTQVPTVWDTTTGSGDVVVAVIDTGNHAAHPDLAGVSYVAEYDFVDGDAVADDRNGHGTAAIGVIAAQHNGIGTAGLCPTCRIMPLKAMGADGTGSHSAIAAAIHHAVDNGADIINLSLGSEGSTNTLHTAVRRAESAGILVVAAAGNSGVDTKFYPAAYPEAIGVAGSNSGDERYSWSNYGTWVGVAAPGCNFTPGYAPATNQVGYTNFCGTSSAAPFTAGIAGLLASARPGITGAGLTTALKSSAVPVTYVSAGRVNAAAALASLAQAPEPTQPAEPTEPAPPSGGGGGALPPEETAPIEEPTEDPVTDVPVDTATSVMPSATSIAYGESVDIAGVVSTSAGSAEGAIVTLLSRPAGTQEWVELAEQPANSAGQVVFTRQPDQTADYRLSFDGSSVQAASMSDVVTIDVRPLVSATAAAGPVLAGRPAVVTGAVKPPRDGMAVVLQRRTSTGWRKVDTGTTDANGRFRLAAPAPVGRSRYRVHVPATTAFAAETSAAVESLGERVRIARVRADAAGDDRRNLNGEFIVLRNTGKTAIQLRGWSVRSASLRKAFVLPGYRLPPGGKVVIHSGRGRAGNGHAYLKARREVWRNSRDTAVVRHPSGPVAARVSW